MTAAKILILVLLLTFALLSFAPEATAQNATKTGFQPCARANIRLGQCIIEIYRWALGLSVLLALLLIIFSGYRYMTSGGNAQAVATAKELFAGAFIGLIILFAAVLILRTINPELVSFKDLRTLPLNK